jgi:hypothetical protein
MSAARCDGALADLGVSRGTRAPRSHPPEEVGRRDRPPAVAVLEVIAETGGLPVREIVPADHVRRRHMPPGEARYLQDYPTGAGRAVDHPVAAGHPALRERLDPGRQTLQEAQQGPTWIPPLPCQIIAEGGRRVRERLPQLVLEDGNADRLLLARVRGRGSREECGAVGPALRLWRLARAGLCIRLAPAWHRETSSWAPDPWIRQVVEHERWENIVIL